jgi:hypothetical protein
VQMVGGGDEAEDRAERQDDDGEAIHGFPQ